MLVVLRLNNTFQEKIRKIVRKAIQRVIIIENEDKVDDQKSEFVQGTD